jgi:hypothetical protein
MPSRDSWRSFASPAASKSFASNGRTAFESKRPISEAARTGNPAGSCANWRRLPGSKPAISTQHLPFGRWGKERPYGGRNAFRRLHPAAKRQPPARAVYNLQKVKTMSGLQKVVLVAVLALPLVLYAQNDGTNMTKQPPPQSTTAESNAGTSPASSEVKHGVFHKILHGMNPSVWFAYLSKREPCDYAYQQAYGVCQSQAPTR